MDLLHLFLIVMLLVRNILYKVQNRKYFSDTEITGMTDRISEVSSELKLIISRYKLV